jgi:starch synthase
VGLRVAYDNKLAHLIEAGSDFFVMPSRYEPCGLNQMYSMRYGTVPVVHAVGGLRDTVIDYEAGDEASGFAFTGLTPSALYCTMVRAVELFRRPKAFQALRDRIMGLDFSWDRSAGAYEALYSELIGG